MDTKVRLMEGDITTIETDAIVNPANTDLLHGGGLAAAISKAGGPIIQEESTRMGTIPLGEAAVTDAGKLKATYVIHAASMELGGKTTETQLRNALANVYKRVDELGIGRIAMPSVGTGVGGFDVSSAAMIQMQMASDFIAQHPHFSEMVFVLHSDADMQAYQAAYNKVFIDTHAQS